MDRLSDCTLLSVFYRSPVAAALTKRLRKKSYQLRTHITVHRVGQWLDEYTNLQHLTINMRSSSLWRHLTLKLESLGSETCERLKTARIVDNVAGQYVHVHGIDTILPILERCKNLELLQLSPVDLTAEDVKKLATLPTFHVLAASSNRTYIRECAVLRQYETAQAHLSASDCFKIDFGTSINAYQQEDLSYILSCRCIRQLTLSLESSIAINSSCIEELELESRSDVRVTLMAPNLTSLELGPRVEVEDVVPQLVPRLSSLILEGMAGEARLPFINSLPSLTSLILTDCDTEALYQLKCPSLTHLNVSITTEDESIDASKLPSSLKSLVVVSDCTCYGFRETSLEYIDVISNVIEELPSTVTSLDVIRVDPIYLSNCKHLKRLSSTIRSDFVAPWPDSITSLDLQGSSAAEWPSIALPRALRSLRVDCDYKTLPEHWNLSRLENLSGRLHLTERQKEEYQGIHI